MPAARDAWSFRVALRSEPVYAPGALHPFVNFGFARQPLDVSDFGTGTVSFDLPVAVCEALRFEDDRDFRGFGHGAEYALPGQGRKPYYGLPYSN